MPTPNSSKSDVIPFPTVPDAAPVSKTGYSNVRLNAMKHGILSRHVVLAHEDRTEFGELLTALAAEHQPSGPTEVHLVEELASVIWRKRRVLMAEGAAINRGLLAISKARYDRPLDPDGPARAGLPFQPRMADTRFNHPLELAEAIRLTPEEARAQVAEAEEDLRATLTAAQILRRGGGRAYGRAIRALTPGSASCWGNSIEEGEASATAEDLMKHIEEFLLPYCRQVALEAQSHEAIKSQTLGEGVQAHRLEKLNRYETHLDRKLERTLAMLLKLKELRGANPNSRVSPGDGVGAVPI
jgi:hypothetical protein